VISIVVDRPKNGTRIWKTARLGIV